MSKDRFEEILKEHDAWNRSGQFRGKSAFKADFFAAAKQIPESSEAQPGRRRLILIFSAVSAAAAMLVILFPLLFSPAALENDGKNAAGPACRLVKELKTIFPETNVGLCLIDGDLNTFESEADKPCDILVNYSLKRVSDGKEIKLSLATGNNNKSDLNYRQVAGSIWVFQPDKKVFTIDTDLELQLDNETRIKISDSRLLDINAKGLVSEFEFRGRKYQLYQSVCRI